MITIRPDYYDRRILVALSEQGGFTPGQIARALGYTNIRSNAQIIGRELRLMEQKNGWVKRIDDQAPSCWTRTPAGTEAMNVGAR